MPQGRYGKRASALRRFVQGSAVEALERRWLLAAHIVGNPTVFATIQSAVDAASPGATINVDAGTYPELVTVSKKLTIRGAQAGVDGRGTARVAGSSPESIITGANVSGYYTSAFYINANDVTLDGFVVQGNTSQGQYGAGIVIAPGRSGTHVMNNVVQMNISGLFLANASATDAAVIQYNLFRYNNQAGSDGGRGIYTDGGVSGGYLTNVTIDSNAFFCNRGTTGTTFLEAAIALESRASNSQSNVRITNNTFDSNGKAVLAYNASGILIQGNQVTGCADHFSGALRFEGGVTNCTIRDNNIYDNTGYGVNIDTKALAVNSSGFVITHNNFYHNSTYYGTNGSVRVAGGTYDGPMDLTNNYWNSATGPGGDGPGTGDTIALGGNNVTFSPWATAPVVPREGPDWGTPATPGAVIQIEDFDHGGEGIAYHDSTASNLGGQYRATEGVDIGATGDTGGGFSIGWTPAGEWLNYTVNLAVGGAYNIDFRVSNNQIIGGTFHLECDGQNVTGPLVMPNTGSYSNWQTVTKVGAVLPSGTHVLRLVLDTNGNGGGIGNFNWFRLTSTAPVLPPLAPSALTATAVSSSQINLAWQDNSNNETGFTIDRSTDGLNFSTIAQVGANVTTYADVSGLAPATTYFYRVRATGAAGDSANTSMASALTLAPSGTSYLSDLPWVSATAGWGTVHRDQSIVGNPLTLRGVIYAKGIGTHATSQIVYNLQGLYTSFLSDVGIDDEELTRGTGTVDFQVLADGKLLFDSGVVTNTTPTVHINVSVIGVRQLTLLVGDGGDGIDYDHADWAGARLIAP